jgi:peptidyl-prolyl cis-trans isomerase SDCCAG10
MREEFLASGKAIKTIRKDLKGDVISRLHGFEMSLKEAASLKNSTFTNKAVQQTVQEDEWECPLHFIKNCSSCRDTFGETVSDDDEDWMTASLKFKKEVGANVYEPKIDDYTVVDPRKGYIFLTLVPKRIRLVETFKF